MANGGLSLRAQGFHHQFLSVLKIVVTCGVYGARLPTDLGLVPWLRQHDLQGNRGLPWGNDSPPFLGLLSVLQLFILLLLA